MDSTRHYRLAPIGNALAALTIRSDTFLNLAGASIELTPGCHSSLVASERHAETHNVRISGGEIVGNGTQQPRDLISGRGITPTFYFPKCDGLELSDLQMRDTNMYAVHATGDDGVVRNVKVDGAIGGGVHLSGARWRIGEIDVRNVVFLNAELCEGNPFIVSLRDSAIGRVRCENFGYGVKLQDGCSNVTIDSITAVGGPNNEPHPNPLVKIQGMNDARGRRFNQHLRIKSITTQGGSISGLYVIYSEDVQIDRYSGRDNCHLPYRNPAYLADVLLLESADIRFGLLEGNEVRNCGLWIDKKAERISVDNLKLTTARPNAKSQLIRSSSVRIGKSELVGFSS